MKGLIFVVILIFFLTNLVSSIYLNPFFYDNNGRIRHVSIYSTIEKNNLHNNIIFEGYINNETLAKEPSAFFHLTLISGEPEKRPPIILNKNIIVCDGGKMPGGNYIDHNFNCETKIENTVDFSNDRKDLTIRFNLSELSGKDFLIIIDYTLEDIIIIDGNFFVGWIRTECQGNPACPEAGLLVRTLMLPTDSIIESWNNFKISRHLDDRWVLETKGSGEAMVWYRDVKKERIENIKRNLSIIFLGTALSFIFSLILSQRNLSKRTKNLLIISSLFLLITSLLLFYSFKNFISNIVLVISYTLFIFFGGLAHTSIYLDKKRLSWKKEIKIILKLIKTNRLKTAMLFILPLITLYIHSNNNVFSTFFFVIGTIYVIFFMKTNKPI